MVENCVVVFTAKTVEQLLASGGSASWKLNRQRALESEYLVCARNRHTSWGEADSVPHCSGFLVGKISGVVAAPVTNSGDVGRWLIQISEYALIDIPGVWAGWRFPVRYTHLSELGIDTPKLEFKTVPEAASDSLLGVRTAPPDDEGTDGVQGLTIAEAKSGLAKTFGVDPTSIEITIRG
jgi:hypothetical protein